MPQEAPQQAPRAPRNAEPPQRPTRPRYRHQRPKKGSKLGVWIGASVVIAIVVLVAVVTRSGATGIGNFEMTAYQGGTQLGGSTVFFDEVKSLAVGKPIVINFWGGTCPPCRAEMPGFLRVYERHQDDFLMIGLDVGPFMGLGTETTALQLLDELRITYPAAAAVSREPIADFGVTGLPRTYFFDAEGDLVDQRPLMDERTFEAILTRLIGATAAKAGESGDA